MGSQKGFAPVIIIIVIIAVLGIGGAWFLYAKQQLFMAEKGDLENILTKKDADIEKLKNEKAKSDQELAVLKANPLVKEAELLHLKLENIETDLIAIKGKVAPLEDTMTKIRLYADVVAALDQNLAPMPPNYINGNLKMVDDRIGALNDSEVTEQWGRAKSGPGSGGDMRTYFLIISKVIGLLPY